MEGIENAFEISEDVHERECMEILRLWVETEAKFHGRTDDDFLLNFLRGCKFKMEKTKKKMNMYYESKKKIPQWWSERNVAELEPVIRNKVTVILIDKHLDLPTLAITIYSRISRSSELLNMYLKQHTLVAEVALRRRNVQKNGVVWVLDWRDYPMWIITKFANPFAIYKIIFSFYMALPIRVKSVHVVNFPSFGLKLWQIVKLIVSEKMTKRVNFYSSDYSQLKNNIDERLLPEEYGGSNGPLSEHEDSFNHEMYELSDYLKDDEKFGFR